MSLGLVLAAAPVLPDTSVPLTVSGSQATGSFRLPGGIAADLTLSFESATGLTPNALAVTAALVSPLDTTLLSRLPPSGVGIPAAFPVVVRIEATAGSTLSFHGLASVALHTANLDYVLGSPLALYTAHGGGAFHDITGSLGSGSVRAGGTTGTFSEFLLVTDLRGIDVVIGEKFDALQGLLTDNAAAMPADVASELGGRLDTARSLYQSGATAAAVTEIDGFSADVAAQSGTAIPDLWQAGSDAPNVAGLLRAGADTLRFSLNRKATGSP